jgi:hypothetical protein
MALAAWTVGQDQRTAERLQPRAVAERLLEDWITDEPDLAITGITWVARQLVLPDRSRLDLLGVAGDDWVIAELKAGAVGRLTLSQALHYLVYVGSMPREELGAQLEQHDQFRNLSEAKQAEIRELLAAETADNPRRLSILLVGTGRNPDLELGVRFFEDRSFDVPIRVVTFDLFEAPSGHTYLVREADDAGDQSQTPSLRTLAAVQQRADERGVGSLFNSYVSAAGQLGLRVKPWVRAVTITPPQRGNPTLLYVRPESGVLHVWADKENFRLHLGVDSTEFSSLGSGGDFDEPQAKQFLARFRDMIERARQTSLGEATASTAELATAADQQ